VSVPLTIAVFASGKGSNFQAILQAIESGTITNAKIAVVISNNSDAGALAVAQAHGIAALHVSRKQFENDRAFNQALINVLETHRVNFIVLAGYMKKIDASVIERFRNRIVNIHPALLPAFGGAGMYGMHVHEAVLAQKSGETGATVHLVDEAYDRGPIVLQEKVRVHEGDTPEILAERVLKIEHTLYPEAIRLFAEGKVKIDGQHVTILN
jgi:phosphoribosylglycinamide formyltransferase-1